jgi:hypothetical protein
MSTTGSLTFYDADSGAALTDRRPPTDRDREYSCMLYFISWGRWPREHKAGFFALLPDGQAAQVADAMMPLDHPVHSAVTGRLLEGTERLDHVIKREKIYEERATAVRAESATTAVQKGQSAKTPPITFTASDKDRLHAYQKASVHRVKKRNPAYLKADETYMKKTEKARREALEKVAAGMVYLERVGYNGVGQLNRLLEVSRPTPNRLVTHAH